METVITRQHKQNFSDKDIEANKTIRFLYRAILLNVRLSSRRTILKWCWNEGRVY